MSTVPRSVIRTRTTMIGLATFASVAAVYASDRLRPALRMSRTKSTRRRMLCNSLIALILSAVVCCFSTLQAAPDAELTYVGQFGSLGAGVGQFRFPTDIDVMDDGRLLISDSENGRLQICTVSGQCEVLTAAVSGGRNSVIDGDGNIIVTSQHLLTFCDPDGACSWLFGARGSALGQFEHPVGIDIDTQGRLVIADRLNHRVQFCDYDGNCSAFGTLNASPQAMPGEFWEPFSILAEPDGTILVGEVGNEVISVCNEAGECSARLWTPLASGGTGIGEFANPSDMARTSRGDLFVTELRNDRVQLCDITVDDPGDACIVFGEEGTGNGQFDNPTAVYIDEQDRVYVAEGNNHRIQILQLTYNSPPPFSVNPGLNDAWFNAATGGQGFFINVFPDLEKIFVGWFTYETANRSGNPTANVGEPWHRWLVAVGGWVGNKATLDVTKAMGGVFDDPAPVTESDPGSYGTLVIEFHDCLSATVTYDLFGIQAGQIPITRIVGDNVALCEILVD